MKNIAVAILIIVFALFGIMLSLISIYSAPDGNVHFFEAGMFWLGSSISILGLLYFFKDCKKNN